MDAFWSGIASSTRVRGGEGAAGDGRRPASAPLDAQSEPDSSDSDEDGFDPDFAASTGVRRYLEACQREGVVPVQQLIATLDQESVFLAHRGIGPRGGRPLFECLLQNRHITALDISVHTMIQHTLIHMCRDNIHTPHQCCARYSLPLQRGRCR